MNLEYFLNAYLRNRPLFISLIRAKEAELFQRYLPLKRPILDVGCGDGFFAKETFAKNIKYQISKIKTDKEYNIDIGLDLEESRIDETRKLNIYKKLVTYDGLNIPFPNNSFSTIVSNCVLEHVDNLNALVKDIYRVLKPNGFFLTTVMARPWEENLFGAKIFGRLYKDWMRRSQIHRNLLTNNEWDKVFQNAGFKIDKSIGYLSPQACQLIDICHYLSVPSLISYKLTGKWVLLPNLTKVYPVKYFSNILSESVKSDRSGAIFFVLKK